MPPPRISVARPTNLLGHDHAFFDKLHLAPETTSGVHIYLSHSRNPFVNLAFEQVLMQRLHEDRRLLFLYRNRPSLVIGRNQNPFLETNLPALSASRLCSLPGPGLRAAGGVDLVRRRSGGGAVFHDGGNLNWSAVTPAADFDRDRHALLVTRALAAVGVPGVRVNARHDIEAVVGRGEVEADADAEGGRGGNSDAAPSSRIRPGTYKVSGSAYKLTRRRALHHGTCLLDSPHVGHIAALLRSPAEPFISARGVSSTRSPVANVLALPGVARRRRRADGGDDVDDDSDGTGGPPPNSEQLGLELEAAICREFQLLHGPAEAWGVHAPGAMAAHGAVRDEVRALQSPEWIVGQTPQFEFSTRPAPRPVGGAVHEGGAAVAKGQAGPEGLPEEFRADFTIRHGVIEQCSFSGARWDAEEGTAARLGAALAGRELWKLPDWKQVFAEASEGRFSDEVVGEWFNEHLPRYSLLPNPDRDIAHD